MPQLMKGKKWSERKHLVQYPVVVEPKIDEIRCHIRLLNSPGKPFEILSYSGKPLNNLDNHVTELVAYMYEIGMREIDCGVMVNNSFDASFRYTRSKKVPEDLKYAKVVFHLYDLLHSIHNEYLWRKAFLTSVGRNTAVLPHEVCINEEEVIAAYDKCRSLGYEGAMVKRMVFSYAHGKRTDDWLKMKPDEDADGTIIALHEAVCGKDQPDLDLRVGDKLGRIGSVTLRLDDGSIATPHGIAHSLGEDMLKHPDKYLGERAEFKYMERDRQGGYRHPTFHRVRE
jgi:ATP-dependent DNA ligase